MPSKTSCITSGTKPLVTWKYREVFKIESLCKPNVVAKWSWRTPPSDALWAAWVSRVLGWNFPTRTTQNKLENFMLLSRWTVVASLPVIAYRYLQPCIACIYAMLQTMPYSHQDTGWQDYLQEKGPRCLWKCTHCRQWQTLLRHPICVRVCGAGHYWFTYMETYLTCVSLLLIRTDCISQDRRNIP